MLSAFGLTGADSGEAVAIEPPKIDAPTLVGVNFADREVKVDAEAVPEVLAAENTPEVELIAKPLEDDPIPRLTLLFELPSLYSKQVWLFPVETELKIAEAPNVTDDGRDSPL